MTYSRKTGGNKEFRYTKEDTKRIESEDTESTKKFKEMLRRKKLGLNWKDIDDSNSRNLSSERVRELTKKYINHHNTKNKSNSHHKKKSSQSDYVEIKTKETNSKDGKKESEKLPKVLAWLLVPFYFLFKHWKLFLPLILIISAAIYLAGDSVNIEYEEVEKTRLEIINQTIPSTISFSKYLDDPYTYDKKEITLKGFLMRYVEGEGNSGVYVESLKDDEGNRIDFEKTPYEYIKLFPHTGETKELYEISGTFKRRYKKILLLIEEIKDSKRDFAGIKQVEMPINYIEKIEIENKIPRYLLLKNSIFNTASNFKKGTSENIDKLKIGEKGAQLKETVGDLTENTKGIVKKIIETSADTIDDFKWGINETEIENQIFDLVNAERKRKGRGALVRNSYLDSLAKSHSEKMINQNFFEHSGHNLGENIFLNPIHSDVVGCGSTYTSASQGSCMVEGWIDSPGHYANMISYSYVSTGIGVACDSTECKATQNFR